MIWLRARAGGDLSPGTLADTLPGTTFEANPDGWPLIVRANQHTTHPSYIGRARADGAFEILGEFPPRPPEPYPAVIVPEDWRPLGAR